jgi:hypothetical protein
MEMHIDARAVRDALRAQRARLRAVVLPPQRVRACTLRWRPLHGPQKRTLWLRLLTLFVLMFATPGVTDVLQASISAATGIECCDGDCDEGCEDCCPETCVHCMCCAHSNATAASAVLVPHGPVPEPLTFASVSDRAYSSGYRAPPFRPPTS